MSKKTTSQSTAKPAKPETRAKDLKPKKEPKGGAVPWNHNDTLIA